MKLTLVKSENEKEIKYVGKLEPSIKVVYSKEINMYYNVDINKVIIKRITDEVIFSLKELLKIKDVENLLQEIIIDYSVYSVRPDIVEKANKLLYKYRNNKIEIPIDIIENFRE